MIRIFIDESGTPDPFKPNLNNFGERYFTLVGIVIDEKNYNQFKRNFKEIKTNFKKYIGSKEIKSRDIRRSNPFNADPKDPPEYDFWKYGKLGVQKYYEFCNSFEFLVTNTDFKIISVGTDKITAQTLYPHKNILITCLTDLWERIAISHALDKITKSRIIFDPRKSLDDNVIKISYDNFVRYGSWFVTPERLKRINLYKRVFANNSEESIGLQLADYCAYPVKRYIETKRYPFFERVIKPKLCGNATDKRSGKVVYMALKTSLCR